MATSEPVRAGIGSSVVRNHRVTGIQQMVSLKLESSTWAGVPSRLSVYCCRLCLCAQRIHDTMGRSTSTPLIPGSRVTMGVGCTGEHMCNISSKMRHRNPRLASENTDSRNITRTNPEPKTKHLHNHTEGARDGAPPPHCGSRASGPSAFFDHPKRGSPVQSPCVHCIRAGLR